MIELIAGPGALVLRGRATRAESKELKRLLLDYITSGRGARELDWSGLEAIDVAGAQVLIAFKRSVQPESLRLGPCSPAVRSYLNGCGLAGVLLED